MNRLQAIRPFGQRIWLDNLSRELIASGELARLLADDGIAGVTSNPAIFYKAISSDASYQGELAVLKQDASLSAEARYEKLVVADIQAACDLLLPQYEASQGNDGYVSLEVSPELSRDEAGTLAAARRLWAEIGRANAMIKIPATAEGIRAFQALTREGVNVNITLLFSLPQVEAVWDAYIAGLSARLADGQPVAGVKAVASFFLSRVDSLLDPQVAEPHKGKVAIALSKAAYARYQERFHGEAFAKLRAAGARPQFLLWASTGTKNPAYRDVLYVESLIGDETVNTVPDATMAAFRDHGEAALTLPVDMDAAQALLAEVEAAGIDLAAAGEKLQQDGLKLFEDAFAQLLKLTA
ncbi:transaldolase [Chromobacterium violaceum]|uniref:transaldolase n=1 Tax=Chromobacterium violaceum TaxID=536 RepID=UPI000652E9A8|nr:transaldolase [Chromobacterium violaceum]KMN50845.1 transaldolase [Chromobacterium violaceum]KMN85264.1 transaldolase [Chromobacterium violaceum]KMN89533.1 transaldolase [Chromobacterium violaceum]KMO03575.1 transaldolase [Chromobacterium violaceum]MBA8733920.1 transaldolase [Chromobacterium violaceum]